MSGTDQGSPMLASGPRAPRPGVTTPCAGGRAVRLPIRMVLLVLAVIFSGTVITALVHNLGAPHGAARTATEVQSVSRGVTPENNTLIWWGIAIIVVGAAALLTLRVRAQQRRSSGVHPPSLPAPQQQIRNTLEMLLARNSAGTEAENWSALLSAVELLQHELDAHYHAQPMATAANPGAGPATAQHILDALPIGIVQVDSAGNVRYANAAATTLLQLRGSGPGRLTDRLAQPTLAETILNLRHQVGGLGVDCRFSTRAGPVVVRLSAISPGAGRDDLVVVAEDISELKQAERTRDEFLAHLTHELRTPLTNIQAYAETLNDDFFDDEKTRRECYDVIMGEARRLAKLIEDVLSVSQIDAGAARLTRSPVRVDDLLRDAARELQAAADAKGIELALDIAPRLPTLNADRFRLQQVWTNLLNNAIKFTPTGGAVKASIEADERVLRVTISDNGIGIAPRWHKLIFEKFFRVQDPAVQATDGTGLGLALVRDIVRLHGGSACVDSAPGAGARFTVELPITVWTAQTPISGRSGTGEVS